MPNLLPGLLIFLIWGSATVAGALPYLLLRDLNSMASELAGIALAPPMFIMVFVTVAGLLSRLAHKAIIPGKFPRLALDKVYFWRRVYGACWTQVYYFKPVLAVCLSIPVLKRLLYRSFGYRGRSLNFTVYPDTWVRDLPVLNIGEGAYLANRATIGTNICMPDNTILVDAITLGERALIGHLVVLGPGCEIKAGAEIGVGATIGIRTVIGEKSSIKPSCFINHGVVMGREVEVGTSSYVGLKARIADGIRIPAGSNVPAGAVINHQEDIDEIYSSETSMLRSHLGRVAHVFAAS